MLSPYLGAAATSMVWDELQVQLLARERELDSREGTIIASEDGLVISEWPLGRACLKCDVELT
jgi:hypothetical protein